jgi:hypothetical protein
MRPSIWRRVQVRSDVTLAKLHRIVQTAMGWYDSHLHQFIVGDTYYGVPSIDDLSEVEDESAMLRTSPLLPSIIRRHPCLELFKTCA